MAASIWFENRSSPNFAAGTIGSGLPRCSAYPRFSAARGAGLQTASAEFSSGKSSLESPGLPPATIRHINAPAAYRSVHGPISPIDDTCSYAAYPGGKAFSDPRACSVIFQYFYYNGDSESNMAPAPVDYVGYDAGSMPNCQLQWRHKAQDAFAYEPVFARCREDSVAARPRRCQFDGDRDRRVAACH